MKNKKRFCLLASLVLFLVAFAEIQQVFAEDKEERVITFDGKFSPVDLKIPAGQKVKVIIKNNAQKPIEFESHDLHREKVIAPGAEAVIFIGPVHAGTYTYFDEFSEDVTATITAE